MTRTFSAKFDGRAIVPDEPTDLPVNQPLEVTVTTANGQSRRPRGTPGRELLQFAGTMTPAEAEEQRRIIEEGCGRVHDDEW